MNSSDEAIQQQQQPDNGSDHNLSPATPPFQLDQQTLTALRLLIREEVSTARNAASRSAPPNPQGDLEDPIEGDRNRDRRGGPNQEEIPSNNPAVTPAAEAEIADASDGTSAPGPTTGQETGVRFTQSDEEGSYPSDVSQSSAESSEDEGTAFTPAWYEKRRGNRIAPRFTIPERFDPIYPVGFQPEAIHHYDTFGRGTSSGRATEASNLYSSAAYLTAANNSLTAIRQDLARIQRKLTGRKREALKEVIEEISDVNLVVFGTYELTATRYELLCGKQGAAGIADPELIESIIDPPAAYSSAGRQAFRQQQDQAVRFAAKRTGSRRGRGRGPQIPSERTRRGDRRAGNPPGTGLHAGGSRPAPESSNYNEADRSGTRGRRGRGRK